MIRLVLVGITALYLLAAVITYLVHLPVLLSGYLLVNGLVILAGLAIERGRYHPAAESGVWEPTGERFVDPGNGHLIEVRYNRESGARRYEDLGPAHKT